MNLPVENLNQKNLLFWSKMLLITPLDLTSVQGNDIVLIPKTSHHIVLKFLQTRWTLLKENQHSSKKFNRGNEHNWEWKIFECRKRKKRPRVPRTQSQVDQSFRMQYTNWLNFDENQLTNSFQENLKRCLSQKHLLKKNERFYFLTTYKLKRVHL